MVAEAVKAGLSATVERKALALATKIADGAAPKRKGAPLEGLIRLEVADGKLYVEGTDLLSYRVRLGIPAPMGLEGAVLVNGGLLSSAAESFGGAALTLDLRDNTLHIKAEGRSARLATRDADDFPSFNWEDPEPIGTLSLAPFKAALERVVWAIAKDDARPVLSGLYCQVAGGRLTLAAADGYALAVYALDIETAPDASPWSGILDGAAMRALASDKLPDGDYQISRSGQRVLFEGPDTRALVMLVPGQFPSYPQLIPPQTGDAIVIAPADLAELLKCARPFIRDTSGIIRLRTVAGGLESLAMADGVGQIDDRIAAETGAAANPWHTAVNLGLLERAIGAAGEGPIHMQPGGEPAANNTPIKLWAEDGWVGLAMPMFTPFPAGWAEGSAV